MKKSLLLLAVVTTAARADLTVTYRIESEAVPATTMTMRMKDGKVRMDASPEVSAIVDSKTGETISLMHGQKMAMKMPGDLLTSAQSAAASSAGNATWNPPQATGRTETITGFQCEEYLFEGPGGEKIEVWVTKDIPEGSDLFRQFSTFSKSIAPSPLPEEATLDGFPIRTKIGSGQGAGTQVTVVALSRDDLSDDDFKIPAGYRKMDMPAIPGR